MIKVRRLGWRECLSGGAALRESLWRGAASLAFSLSGGFWLCLPAPFAGLVAARFWEDCAHFSNLLVLYGANLPRKRRCTSSDSRVSRMNVAYARPIFRFAPSAERPPSSRPCLFGAAQRADGGWRRGTISSAHRRIDVTRSRSEVRSGDRQRSRLARPDFSEAPRPSASIATTTRGARIARVSPPRLSPCFCTRGEIERMSEGFAIPTRAAPSQRVSRHARR